MSEWQSIGTAPKDGTHILLCDARRGFDKYWTFNQQPPFVAHYWPVPGEEGFYLSGGATENDEPLFATHWAALQEPPK